MTQTVQKYKYVPVRADTKAKLDSVGRKGQTYDQIIRELLSKWEHKN